MTGPARILHLFDAGAGWQQRIGATQLTRRLPAGRFCCGSAAIDGRVRGLLSASDGKLDLLPRYPGLGPLGAPALRRYLHSREVAIVQAWGVPAAVAAAQADPDVKLVVELFDPALTSRDARKLRAIQGQGGFGIACTSATIRRRLIEQGVEPAVCTLIRPGVDFAVINAARQGDLRGQLGLPPETRIFIAPEPATRSGGQFTAYWATAVRSFLKVPERLIIPGDSPERARIARLARQQGVESCLCCPSDRLPFEELLANADVLLVPSAVEVPTTAVGWAMAAGVPVIATALYATAELLSHKRNGLLIKPDQAKRVALKLAALLDQEDDLAKVKETARGQAYEVLGVRRYVDQHTRLYENLLGGQEPGQGLADSAIDQ